MRRPSIGAGFTVFILFFGLALLDALGSGDRVRAAFWVAIGAVFLWMDQPRRTHR